MRPWWQPARPCLKDVGEQVEEGEPIAEVETDKMTVELEAPEAGVLACVEAAAGAAVAEREQVAVIDEAKEGR